MGIEKTEDHQLKRFVPDSIASQHTHAIPKEFVGNGMSYQWETNLDKINIIRNGLTYQAIEVIAQRANASIKQFLDMLQIPQTTYNKKKREGALLDGHSTELLLAINDLIAYGEEVFNQELPKFHHWLLSCCFNNRGSTSCLRRLKQSRSW